MIEDSPSQLPADIAESAHRIIILVAELKGWLVALRESRTHEEAVGNYNSAMGTQCCITAEAQKLKAWVSAAKATGLIAKPGIEAIALELHPAHRERTPMLPALIQSLHRAGDHTLDPEEAGA